MSFTLSPNARDELMGYLDDTRPFLPGVTLVFSLIDELDESTSEPHLEFAVYDRAECSQLDLRTVDDIQAAIPDLIWTILEAHNYQLNVVPRKDGPADIFLETRNGARISSLRDLVVRHLGIAPY